ncbi:YHYH protein [Tenacibaculum xiamenense]|uniref:YHYH protein n=1 Tax=Tenacibaculum xiamenense TaxID=1261553 RepID=UPI0038933C66
MKNIKKMVGVLMIATLIGSCSSDNNSDVNENTDPINETVYDIRPILSKFDNVEGLSYEIQGDYVVFTTNNLPDHKSPYWDQNNPLYEAYNGTNPNWHQNPNTIQSQNITLRIPLYPKEAANKQETSLGPIGISVNGVVFYNQYAGPNNQPLTNEIDSFDQYWGHPQQAGQYHYHIEPLYLTEQYGKSAFLGLLADGFPVYGPLEGSTTITSDDLDVYHGHISATVDFPDGIYHYNITADAPYLNGNGYYGTPGTISQ